MSSQSSAADIKCGVYDVNLPARAIAPIHDTNGDKQSYFLVGSCAAHDGTTRNQICVLSYGEDRRDVNCSAVVNHDGEVLKITTPGNATSTDDIATSGRGGAGGKLFATTHTTHNNPNDITSTVFQLRTDGSAIDTICTLPQGCSAVEWHPLKLDSNELRVVLGDGEIGIAEFDTAATGGEAKIISRYQLPSGLSSSGTLKMNDPSNRLSALMQPTVISWDPIYNDRIIAAKGTNLYQIDTRSKTTGQIVASNTPTSIVNANGSSSTLLNSAAHGFGAIRTIHSNRNELNLLVTGGDDGMLSFWDLRKAGNGPLLSQRVHDHWVQKVSFNRMSDKTLLTCSSDRSAKVWNLGDAAPWGAATAGLDESSRHALGTSPSGTGASKFFGNKATSPSGGSGVSGTSLGEFGDSVLDCCWSALTPFVTAAVSYNGKVIIGTVSKATRDGIYGIV